MVESDLRTVAVLGAGTMGHGIAEVAALAGYDVTLRDVNEELARRGYENASESLDRLVERGEYSREDADDALERITPVAAMAEAVGDADFVVEAVPEKREIKESVYADAEAHLPESAVLATNTSSLSVTALAATTERPERFVGMHFFNPPVRMRLVEVVRGERTSDRTVEATEALAESMGKTPIRVRKDSPGFVVNRVLLPALDEAAWLRREGEATVEAVDASVTHGLGLPMGAFELLDFIGIDVVVDVLDHLHEELGEAYAPCPLLADKVEAGALGRKSGQGFYDYGDGGADVSPDAASEDLQTLLLARMANETAKLVADEVAPAADVDRAMELGAGFPEGPAAMADETGLDRLVTALERRREETGAARYDPAPLLVEMAARGERFLE